MQSIVSVNVLLHIPVFVLCYVFEMYLCHHFCLAVIEHIFFAKGSLVGIRQRDQGGVE